MTAKGFAVVIDDVIQIKTVADTEQAAQVNGLATLFRIMPQADWPAHYINHIWHRCVAGVESKHIEIVLVEVAKCE